MRGAARRDLCKQLLLSFSPYAAGFRPRTGNGSGIYLMTIRIAELRVLIYIPESDEEYMTVAIPKIIKFVERQFPGIVKNRKTSPVKVHIEYISENEQQEGVVT